MGLFSRNKAPGFLSDEEAAAVVAAIGEAEQRTSGEIRVFIESRCSYVDAIDRARELFHELKMDGTEARNGVLLYIATEDHQAALFADEGIYARTEPGWWSGEMQRMLQAFREHHPAEGLVHCVRDIGEVLREHFPFDRTTDKNELPDDLLFGR